MNFKIKNTPLFYTTTLPFIWKLALKNNLRHPLRSFLLSLSISIAVTLAVWIMAIFSGLNRQIATSVRNCNIGHYELIEQQFYSTGATENYLKLSSKDLQTVSTFPKVKAFSPELLLQGQVAAPEGTRQVELIGIIPKYHDMIFHLNSKLLNGSRSLSSESDGVIIGESLAKFYKISLGDSIVFHYQNSKSELTSTLLTVQGIYHFNGPSFEMKTIYLTQNQLYKLYTEKNMEEETVLANRLLFQMESDIENKDLQYYPPFQKAAATFFDQLKTPMHFLSWHKLNPEMAVVITFHQGMIYFFLVIVSITILITVFTPISIKWQERVGELKMFLTIGIESQRILILSLCEGIQLSLFSSLFALILLFIIIGIQSITGIDPSIFTGGKSVTRAGISLSEKVYPIFSMEEVVVVIFTIVLVVLISYLLAVKSVLKQSAL